MPEFDPKTRDLLIAMLLMAGLLVVVALGIQVISIYRRRLRSRGDSPAELAESFREAYEAGELDTDEYRQIRETLDRGPVVASPPRPSPDPAPEAATAPADASPERPATAGTPNLEESSPGPALGPRDDSPPQT